MVQRVVVLAVLTLLSRAAAGETVTEVHYVMGTYLRITAEDADAAAARAALRRCFATARRLDEQFSRFDPHSELSQVNATADREPSVSVSAEMAALLARAKALQEATGGAFDVSVGALTALWRTTPGWPSLRRLTQAQHAAGGDAFSVDGARLVRRRGVQLDLDGIAKGWAVDRCVAQLRTGGIDSAFLSFGESSLYGLGTPAGGDGWEVLVRGVDGERAIGVLRLHDQAVSVSSVFGHERRVATRRIGHIVDPRSGVALASPAVAVVVAASATDAEAFSKAALIFAQGFGGQFGIARSATRTNSSPKPPSLGKRRGLEGSQLNFRIPLSSQERGPGGEFASDRMVSALNAPLGVGERAMIGSLILRPGGVERRGAIPFTPFAPAQPIAAAAEPLR
jgi:FAD:protein FMN transferase